MKLAASWIGSNPRAVSAVPDSGAANALGLVGVWDDRQTKPLARRRVDVDTDREEA